MDVALSIIVLSFNTKALTIRCIETIIQQYRKELEKGELEIVVVDNASTDGSVKEIQNLILRQAQDKSQSFDKLRTKFKIIQNRENYGFAKGCNIGVKEAQGKYVLFLNSDTQVKDRGFLKMVEFLDMHEKAGILGGRLLNPNGSSQPSAGQFYTLPNFLIMIIGGERLGLLRGSPKKITEVDWVSGACMMINSKTYEMLKGFDEHFFMYMEDMELCFRARLQGFSTYFYPGVKIVHQSLGSSNRAFAVRNIRKGILYFYSKHKSYWQYLVVKALLVVKSLVS